MSETCNHDCASCKQDCAKRPVKENTNAYSKVKKVIGIVSGKGGVGKSLVTSMLAVLAQREDLKTAILDADITGPSIPKAFGITTKADSCDLGLLPAITKKGTKVMSINLLLENDSDPVIWRGPVISGIVKQFWAEVIWDKVDIMFIDMPPGTGDVPLTVFQSIPIDGIIIVTSPQELVTMIVSKAVNMAKKMNVPVLGLVENMSYCICPDCGKRINIFGESKLEKTATELDIKPLAAIPFSPELASACDKGLIELFTADWLDKALREVVDFSPKNSFPVPQ